MQYVVIVIAVLLIVLGIRGTYANILAGLGINVHLPASQAAPVNNGIGPGAGGTFSGGNTSTGGTNTHGSAAGQVLS